MRSRSLASLLVCAAFLAGLSSAFAASNPFTVSTPVVDPTTTSEGFSQSFTVSGSFIDLNTGVHTAKVDWGDGTTPDAATISESGGNGTYSFSGSHTYADNGTYSVTVT